MIDLTLRKTIKVSLVRMTKESPKMRKSGRKSVEGILREENWVKSVIKINVNCLKRVASSQYIVDAGRGDRGV